MNKIFVVSDGTGRTAKQALKAALTQFPEPHPEVILRRDVLDIDQIEEVVREAAVEKSFIVHTLVSDNLREEMVRISRIHNVSSIDLMGPMLSKLADFFEHSPLGVPGLFHNLNQEYFKRIDAMQFAFNHDDGQRDHEYDRAEIVLVGVSRTFKTPLSMYLAFKGWFVANYPIVMGIELPESLMSLPKGNVMGLMTQPHELSGLREARQIYLGGSSGDYTSIEFVRRELNHAHDIFRRLEWPVIHVTNKPIEEIASEILCVKRNIDQPGVWKKKCGSGKRNPSRS
ncbi:MAG: pyruvate, water dikinase regulatory protein [Bacteroidota bacterium]